MDSGTYTEAWRRESVTIEPPFAQAWRTRRLLNHQIAADMAKEMKLTSWQKDPTSEGFLVALYEKTVDISHVRPIKPTVEAARALAETTLHDFDWDELDDLLWAFGLTETLEVTTTYASLEVKFREALAAYFELAVLRMLRQCSKEKVRA